MIELKKYEIKVLEVRTYEEVKIINFKKEDTSLSKVLYRTLLEIGENAGLENQSINIIFDALMYLKEDNDKINFVRTILSDGDILCDEEMTYRIIKITCDQEVLYETNIETIQLL